jgi:catechol 2,3-dioxygenase-like lactoylglutathione lyase family enzyme
MQLSMQALLLNVSNLDQSIEFYRDVFDLRPAARGDRVAALMIDETTRRQVLMLREVGGPQAIAPERGFAIPTEESFDWETGPHGSLYVGSPQTVAQKIAANLRALGATRFDLKYGMPGLTHQQLMTNIELYGREVIPRARELLSRSRA